MLKNKMGIGFVKMTVIMVGSLLWIQTTNNFYVISLSSFIIFYKIK